MMASRGMGAISPSKMPKAKRKARRDTTDFTQYAGGGMVPTTLKPSRSTHPYDNWNRKPKVSKV